MVAPCGVRLKVMDRELAFERIVQLLGCKWSLSILAALKTDTCRPSALLRMVEGLPPRVMHRCLGRMERDGLVTKTVFPSVPPHTEYKLSPDGMEFLELLDTVKDLAVRWKGTQLPV